MTTKPVRKLLATDLDGTFLTKDGSVTARNRELLKKANENKEAAAKRNTELMALRMEEMKDILETSTTK